MFYKFLTDFIWTTHVKEHKKIKAELLKVIDSTKKFCVSNSRIGNWSCDLASSFGNLSEDLPTGELLREDFLNPIVWNPLDEMLKEPEIGKKIKPKKSFLTNIWWNSYEPGHNQEIHRHGDSTFSGIYLLDLREENNTVFYSTGGDARFDELKTTKDLVEGEVILFPSHLLHYVEQTKKRRATIAFNVKMEF